MTLCVCITSFRSHRPLGRYFYFLALLIRKLKLSLLVGDTAAGKWLSQDSNPEC